MKTADYNNKNKCASPSGRPKYHKLKAIKFHNSLVLKYARHKKKHTSTAAMDSTTLS